MFWERKALISFWMVASFTSHMTFKMISWQPDMLQRFRIIVKIGALERFSVCFTWITALNCSSIRTRPFGGDFISVVRPGCGIWYSAPGGEFHCSNERFLNVKTLSWIIFNDVWMILSIELNKKNIFCQIYRYFLTWSTACKETQLEISFSWPAHHSYSSNDL